MKSEDTKFDRIMTRLADTDQPAPNFNQWLKDHPQAVKTLISRAERAERSFPSPAQRIWRKIMNSKITKLAAAAVIVIGVIVGIKLITGPDRSGLAFARVLEKIQTENYTYDLTFVHEGQTPPPVHVSVLPSHRVRFDAQGQQTQNVSTIADAATGESFVLFHAQKTVVPTGEGGKTGSGHFLTLLLNPINTLQNLRDGTEEKLGTKKINGQDAEGFKVVQEDQYYKYEIIVWADVETAYPLTVTILMNPVDASTESGGSEMTMDNFDFQVELDEEIFHVPADYTLAWQKDLDQLPNDTKASPQGKHIEQMLTLWSKGREDKALEIFFNIDWTQSFNFSPDAYFFTMTEAEYISLKPKDQQHAMEKIMATAGVARQLVKRVAGRGKEAQKAKDYKKAERYFDTTLRFGKLLTSDKKSMYMIQMVGLAIRKLSAQAMIDLYQAANDNQKLQGAEQQLRQVDAEYGEIKQKLKGG